MGGMGAQELSRFPDQNWCPSPVAGPQRWAVWREGGTAREGPAPSHQQSLGRNRAGPAAWEPWRVQHVPGSQASAARPSEPGSLEGLPLLPELLHRARGRGRAHILLGFL